MPSLFLIRHAEPEITGVFLGQLDPPLSDLGREQARVSLGAVEVAIAYVSPLRRALETATHLRARQAVELAALREIDYGEWTGKTWAAIEALWSELARQKSEKWLNVTPPGGEAWGAFLARVEDAWQTIRNGPSPAAVVAHQGVNAALAHIISGENPLHFSQRYGEVLRIEYEGWNSRG